MNYTIEYFIKDYALIRPISLAGIAIFYTPFQDRDESLQGIGRDNSSLISIFGKAQIWDLNPYGYIKATGTGKDGTGPKKMLLL